MCLPKAQGGLGFRDIKHFNLAMLGKQGWRLMTNPESLCARVLKGKYFPNCDFMATTKKKTTSHTWRAIMAGRKVLQMGCIRRIGDGTTTNIWRDQWLPEGVGFKPLCRKDGALAEQVSELMSPDGLSWDDEALDQNLIPLDAAAAKRIPLGRSMSDIWAWSGERHGLYTVKSGYRLLAAAEAQQRDFRQGKATHSNHSGDPRWQKLWKSKVPPKVRVFWWRIIHDYLPSKANLHRRHIDPLSICDTCGARDETTFHALVECTYARLFWVKLYELTGIKLPVLTPDSWASALLDDNICGETDQSIILCGMWSIWRSRNDRQHGKAPINTGAAIDWALDVCFHLCSVKENTEGTKKTPTPQRWQRPPANTVKVNVDGAFAVAEGSGAIGAVARDAEGEFLMGMTRRLPAVASARAAEAEALRAGVQMIHTVTTGPVWMETDSMEVVDLWNNRTFQRSEYAPIFNDIQELASSFSSFYVMHAKRMANKAAHACARHAASSAFEVWAPTPPSFLLQALQDDCNHV